MACFWKWNMRLVLNTTFLIYSFFSAMKLVYFKFISTLFFGCAVMRIKFRTIFSIASKSAFSGTLTDVHVQNGKKNIWNSVLLVGYSKIFSVFENISTVHTFWNMLVFLVFVQNSCYLLPVWSFRTNFITGVTFRHFSAQLLCFWKIIRWLASVDFVATIGKVLSNAVSRRIVRAACVLVRSYLRKLLYSV